MTTATKEKEIADLQARRKELIEFHNGRGHILGADHWAADWGRVDDEIIRERKAIQDSARQQVLQIDARIADLKAITVGDAVARFAAMAAVVTLCVTPFCLFGSAYNAKWMNGLAIGSGALYLATVASGLKDMTAKK